MQDCETGNRGTRRLGRDELLLIRDHYCWLSAIGYRLLVAIGYELLLAGARSQRSAKQSLRANDQDRDHQHERISIRPFRRAVTGAQAVDETE